VITISYIRNTYLLTDEMVASYVAAQQVQVARDFGPLWGIDDVQCVFVPPGTNAPLGSWEVWFKDHTDQDGALGYHTDEGRPKSYVFTADDLRDGISWTVTASHETLEMLGDPDIKQVRNVGSMQYAYEACDACEDDQFAYLIQGHLMSDFVLPSWFDPNGQAPFTFRNSIDGPLLLAPGGYIGRRVLPEGQWEQLFAQQHASPRQFKRETSRTLRRFRAESDA